MTPKELRTRRRQLELTQDELGKILGKTQGSVGRWERGKSPIPLWVSLAIYPQTFYQDPQTHSQTSRSYVKLRLATNNNGNTEGAV